MYLAEPPYAWALGAQLLSVLHAMATRHAAGLLLLVLLATTTSIQGPAHAHAHVHAETEPDQTGERMLADAIGLLGALEGTPPKSARRRQFRADAHRAALAAEHYLSRRVLSSPAQPQLPPEARCLRCYLQGMAAEVVALTDPADEVPTRTSQTLRTDRAYARFSSCASRFRYDMLCAMCHRKSTEAMVRLATEHGELVG